MIWEEVIYFYILGNVYVGFEENFKGFVIKGKVVDFVVFLQDLVNCMDEEIFEFKVLMIMVDGQIWYKVEGF